MDCLFCSIAAKKIPCHVVYEDDVNLAFLDIKPLSLGHTVIIPKQHSASIADISETGSSYLGLTLKRVSDILHQSVRPDGFTIGINDGPGGRQGVPHLHVHVIPRWNNDKGSNLHAIVQSEPQMPLHEVAQKIENVRKQFNY